MIEHGYVTKLYETRKALNYEIVEHRLFDCCVNPLNPTGLMIIKKENDGEKNTTDLVCPISYTPLEKMTDALLYSQDSFLAYPIIEDISCLLKENSILTTHFKTSYKDFKTENNIK